MQIFLKQILKDTQNNFKTTFVKKKNKKNRGDAIMWWTVGVVGVIVIICGVGIGSAIYYVANKKGNDIVVGDEYETDEERDISKKDAEEVMEIAEILVKLYQN